MGQITPSRSRSGFTLVECIIYATLWAGVALVTMRVLADARLIRSNARDRSVMTLIAQSELEKLRVRPASEFKDEQTTYTSAAWPPGTEAALVTARQPDGNWLADIRMSRESLEGKPQVRLTTIRGGSMP